LAVVRCGRGLVEPRFAGSIEGYIVIDSFSDLDGGEVRVLSLLRNYGLDRRVGVEVVACGTTLSRSRYTLRSGEKLVLESYFAPREGCEVKLVVDGVVLDRETLDVASLDHAEHPSNIVIVFHHHQPPNYGPDSVYRSLWPFTYVWRPVLFPYGLGPYHFHAALLRRLGGEVRLVYNLSPSLIRQWYDILERDVRTSSGEVIESGSELSKVVKETVDLYRELAASGAIEVLTSIYAHTIAGYLVELFGLEDVVRRELEYGYNITKSFMGTDPRGVWLPEMSFSMKLLPVLGSLGLEYTFLDERYHLRAAEGEVGDPYEPYLVQGGDGSSIIAFFRDTELSNDIAFSNNYCSDIHAVKGAYRFAQKILGRCAVSGMKVLTLALDGENWMALSENPPATAVFLETLLSLLKNLSGRGLIKLSTARDVVRSEPPTRKLRYVPSTSWLGSYSKWRGERAEHEEFWKAVEDRVARFREYTARNGLDERAKSAERALWHVLDSDYWWAEFWNEEMLSLWMREFDRYITTGSH